MGVKYLFRVDDISWDMNYKNFSRLRDLFFRYDVKPIIGVIPHNEDPHLKEQAGENGITEERFWREMNDLQQNHGWAVALHGYNHVYVTKDGGIFKRNNRAEFAGLPLEQQEEKVRRGKEILEQNGLSIDAFMAPAHSLDWSTVEALKRNGIFTITDGKGVYPYTKREVLFVPDQYIYPMPYPGVCGVHTAVFHPNGWNTMRFSRLEQFLKKHPNTETFQDVVQWAREKEKNWWQAVNVLSKGVACIEKAGITTMYAVKRQMKKGD